MVRKAKCYTWDERWHLWLIHLCTLADVMIFFCSLGLLTGDLRGWALFDCPWFDEGGPS